MFTISPEIAAKDLDEIHKIGESIRTGEKFHTSSGRIYGIHESSVHPISGPGTVNITPMEYNVLILAKKEGIAAAKANLAMITKKEIFSIEQHARTTKLLELMKAQGVK